MADVNTDLIALFDQHGGAATYANLLTITTRKRLRTLIALGVVVPLWRGIYAPAPISVHQRLAGAGLLYGRPVTACLGTAAQLYGFDTEDVDELHILDADRRHPHGSSGLRVHQRLGAPVVVVGGHRATAPAWSAIEVARSLSRPRALATLDAALASTYCTQADLREAARRQGGRRGIKVVRRLAEVADGRTQSPMESETRLTLLDAGLPTPNVQFAVVDDDGLPKFYLDLAYPDAKIAIEYDGDEFHGGPLSVRRDKARIAWLQDRGWLVIVATADDIRRWPDQFVARVAKHLAARRDAA